MSVGKRWSSRENTVKLRSLSRNKEQQQQYSIDVSPDYLITDSLDLEDDKRPTLVEALTNPRDILATIIVALGTIISIFNILGKYDSTYLLLETSAIILGFVSSAAYLVQIKTGYLISMNVRRGIVDDAAVNFYAALYTGAVSWLALRTSQFCPEVLTLRAYDEFFSFCSIGIFLYSLVAPILTLSATIEGNEKGGNISYKLSQLIVSKVRSNESSDEIPQPPLSETELLRARGLLFIGILGCVFAPDALSFFLGGEEWWGRVSTVHPSQQMLESTTSLFALFATESSMISHRVGKFGVANYQTIVPFFAAVCLILAIIPCVCSLYWLGDGVSFFSFYRE